MNRLGIFLPRRLFCACVVRMFLRVLVWCFGRTCLSLYSVFQPVRFRRILIPTEKFIRMKKIIVLFLVTCTLCRCCVTFARPVEIETAFRILTQRVSHIRITKFDHFTYVMRFAYDAQGRIVSVVESDFRYLDDGTSKPDRISTVEYDGQSMTIADPHSKFSYELADGRAVSMTGAWAETMEFSGECAETYSYDAAGYLFRRTYRDDNAIEYENTFAVADDVFTGWNRLIEGEELVMTNENDSEVFNNLNIDLFGLSEFTFYEVCSPIRLYGVGGRRVRTLPRRIVCRWLTQPDEIEFRTYDYRMDGDYISEVEIRDTNGERIIRLEFFYEE